MSRLLAELEEKEAALASALEQTGRDRIELEALRKEVNEMGIKVSLIEPGSVGTDMQEESPAEQREKQKRGEMLTAEDIARSIEYCLVQPPRCDVVVLQIRPHRQPI